MAEKYGHAWFNLISCHSVQREIIKKVKNYSQPLSWCVNCLVASGSEAKVRSSKRDFVHRSTFHCCCTLVHLCMLQKFEFYPNCRMRNCESVFIKTLIPSWSYNSLLQVQQYLICKKCSVDNVYSCCTFRLAIRYNRRMINLAWDNPQRGSVEVSDMSTYFTFHFSSEKID